MSAYWQFDPYKDREPETPAKVAKVAKEGTGKTITLAGLATLAASPAENANSSFRSVAFTGEADGGHRTLTVVPSLTDIPITIEPKRWLQLRQDAQRFVDQWARRRRRWAGRRWTSSAAIRRIRRIVTTIWAWSGWVAGAEVAAIGARVANLRNSAGTLQRVWKCAVDVSRILPWDL